MKKTFPPWNIRREVGLLLLLVQWNAKLLRMFLESSSSVERELSYTTESSNRHLPAVAFACRGWTEEPAIACRRGDKGNWYFKSGHSAKEVGQNSNRACEFSGVEVRYTCTNYRYQRAFYYIQNSDYRDIVPYVFVIYKPTTSFQFLQFLRITTHLENKLLIENNKVLRFSALLEILEF